MFQGAKKIILTYSPLFDDEDLFKCSSLESFCEFINDKNKSHIADAIIFHEKDILNNNIPERNNTKQVIQINIMITFFKLTIITHIQTQGPYEFLSTVLVY